MFPKNPWRLIVRFTKKYFQRKQLVRRYRALVSSSLPSYHGQLLKVKINSIYMMAKQHERKVKLNQYFIKICSTFASVNNEFNIETNFFLRALDKTTLIWSFIALITNLIKYLQYQKFAEIGVRNQNNTNDFNCGGKYHYELKLTDLILLNYLPCINEFGPLYYGLSCVAIGSPLIWRLYLNYYRPLFSKKGLSSRVRHDGIIKIIRFFVYGPKNEAQQFEEKDLTRTVELELVRAREHHSHLSVELEYGQSYKLFNPISMDQLLARYWRKNKTDYVDNNPSEFYENPIRKHNFFIWQSEARWNIMLRRVITIGFSISILSIPIVWFTIEGLNTVLIYFTIYNDIGQKDFRPNILYYYGIAEQFYGCTQGALFFIFTNFFLIIFHSDLTYLFEMINKDINLLWKEMYSSAETTGILTPEPHNEDLTKRIHMIQTRLWAFFDHIVKIDSFVSKYSLISILTFVITILFGQSYLKVQEPALRRGTIAVVLTSFLSFTILYIISWDIERRVRV